MHARTARPALLSARTLILAMGLGIAPQAVSAASFFGLDLAPGMLEMRPIGIVGSGEGIVIPYKAISEKGVQFVEEAGLWNAGALFPMPAPLDEHGNQMDAEIFQFRPQSTLRGPLDPVKGISVGLIKKPTSAAAMWDTSSGEQGTMGALENPFTAASWATSANVNGSVIGGAVHGDLDGQGVSRHAALWTNGAPATLLPVPVGIRSSEVWAVSGIGDIACGAISERGIPTDQPKIKQTTASKGIVWNAGGFTVVDPWVGGPEAESLAFTVITDDASHVLGSINTTRSKTKGGVYAMDSGSFTLLDGGDVNGDGVINLLDDHDSFANALSGDGSIVGGSIALVPGEELAALWIRDANGDYQEHDFADYLGSFGVAGFGGWTLRSITGVSTDGLAFTGWGINPQGQTTGWVASVPAPGGLAMFGIAGLAVARRRR